MFERSTTHVDVQRTHNMKDPPTTLETSNHGSACGESDDFIVGHFTLRLGLPPHVTLDRSAASRAGSPPMQLCRPKFCASDEAQKPCRWSSSAWSPTLNPFEDTPILVVRGSQPVAAEDARYLVGLSHVLIHSDAPRPTIHFVCTSGLRIQPQGCQGGSGEGIVNRDEAIGPESVLQVSIQSFTFVGRPWRLNARIHAVISIHVCLITMTDGTATFDHITTEHPYSIDASRRLKRTAFGRIPPSNHSISLRK